MGVSMSWLHQMHRRMLFQFATFQGEAEVHFYEERARGVSNLVPNEARLKLWKAWLLWRFLLRRAQYVEGGGEITQTVNLALPFYATLAGASWYDSLMFSRRVALAREAGANLSHLVLDGNQKLWKDIADGQLLN